MTAPRLAPALLADINTDLKPLYSRDATQAGIVHLGIGAFHRAHQAFYTEAVLNQFGGDWAIIGCSLRSPTVRDQLNPQSGLYCLLEKSEKVRFQVIGAVKEVLVGPEAPNAVINAIASPHTKIVSLTITEKGYCHNPATGDLNLQHPDIVHDLSHPMAPRSAVGFIVAGLRDRRQQGVGGLSVLSCDNLPNNGKVIEQVVQQFAGAVSPELAAWIIDHVTFPCSMIDRIVPATTAADLQTLTELAGVTDEGLVVAEPFSQWVIEDNFCQGRPAWDKAGALLVDDVTVYEHMKLRLLNGSHSLLAYSGYLAGYETIDKVMQDHNYQKLCSRFMAQVAKTLNAPEGFDIEQYQQDLRARFANPGLKHRTWQIAMDGSQKVPQRWLASLRDLMAKGEDVGIFALALAAWMRYITGVDEQGNTIEVSDPYAQTFKDIFQKHSGDWPAYAKAVYSLDAIFGSDLAASRDLVKATSETLQAIEDKGVKAVVEDFVS